MPYSLKSESFYFVSDSTQIKGLHINFQTMYFPLSLEICLYADFYIWASHIYMHTYVKI